MYSYAEVGLGAGEGLFTAEGYYESSGQTARVQCVFPSDNSPSPHNKFTPMVDISLVRHAFDLVGQSRRLPVLLEGLIEQTRQAFPLVERTIHQHLQVYEAMEPRDPRQIARLVQELRRWYDAWLPWSECVLLLPFLHLYQRRS